MAREKPGPGVLKKGEQAHRGSGDSWYREAVEGEAFFIAALSEPPQDLKNTLGLREAMCLGADIWPLDTLDQLSTSGAL